MDKKYKNKYRISSARAPFWDYSQAGLYFITICTKDRACLFGQIVRQKMILSAIGEIVQQEWNRSFEIRRELFCDLFVIMPNHLHAILRIVETHGRASLPTPPHRSPKSISSFVAGFKSSATKRINQFRKTPGLPVGQPRFHDHIIRNNTEYQRIRNYIENKPADWRKDSTLIRLMHGLTQIRKINNLTLHYQWKSVGSVRSVFDVLREEIAHR